MSDRCFGCGYMWADCDDNGSPMTGEYCHFEGLDGWAPCEQDDYNYLDGAIDADFDDWYPEDEEQCF